MKFPTELKYTKDHEWAKLDGNIVTIGVTEHAQNALGDIVFIELPEVGRELKTKATFGVVESIKAVSDLYSPITGKVTAVNSDLIDNPGTVNKDPYKGGWMLKLELKDASTYDALMDASAYTKFVESLG